ncbi:MAG: hypothetical protein PPP58_05370 [Natronomonas sp.]
MTDTLGVEIGRTGLHSLEAPGSFETGDSFSVAVRNHGAATHVHLHLDDDLSSVATLAAGNHYVDAEETRLIDIELADPEAWSSDAVRGQLKVVTGHGTETRYVSVTLDRRQHTESVEVDPELSRPQTEESDPPLSPAALRMIPIGALAGVAIILAVAALTAGGSLSSFLAGGAVVAAIACAVSAYYLSDTFGGQ